MLKAHAGWNDAHICEALDVSRPSVERTRRRYVTDGFDLALNGKHSTRVYKRKLDGRAEAHLIALVCGEPPTGHAQWSMRLLASELVKLEQVALESISHETVRQVLKKTN